MSDVHQVFKIKQDQENWSVALDFIEKMDHLCAIQAVILGPKMKRKCQLL